ncbi:MAG: tRNA-dihydrouridine synthase [Planctomycetaceae bacterium]|nr:tRNA-dihydrouridine synthase [Planctomycetaceae bacterium]
MRFGNVSIGHPFSLAPMEEHTSFPFRKLMRQHGASFVCSERLDAVDVARGDRRALKLLFTNVTEKPRAGQISGADPAVMAEAARNVEEQGFDIVDLNFESPLRRLCKRGEGGALMSDPPAIGRLVEAVIRAVTAPVTLTIRTGPDGEHMTAVEVAKRAESAGAAAVAVHARNVAQGYVGEPDWSVVRLVKQSVGIPVFGSGGVREAVDAVRFLRESGADGVGIGRGCLGNPWIFREARALWNGGAVLPPTLAERAKALIDLAEDEYDFYGPALAIKRLPRMSCYFAKFVPGFDEFKQAVQKIRFMREFHQLVREHFRPRRE